MASPDPNCTCYYDDYGNYRDPKEDCPSHGQCTCPVEESVGHQGQVLKYPGRRDEQCPQHGKKCPNCNKTVCPEGCAAAGDPPRWVSSYDPPPDHYAGDGGLDPWKYIEAHGLDYWAGNVIKYVTRAGRKEIATVEEDLIKARNFLNYMIERERRESPR